jgi:hypothetical protein
MRGLEREEGLVLELSQWEMRLSQIALILLLYSVYLEEGDYRVYGDTGTTYI